MRQAGEVAHADVIAGPDGRSKGFGVVQFETAAAARKAIRDLNDTDFQGRQLRVSMSNRGAGGAGAGGGGARFILCGGSVLRLRRPCLRIRAERRFGR